MVGTGIWPTGTVSEVWHDLMDVRGVDPLVRPELDLKEPTFENVEVGEVFGPVQLMLTDYRALRFAFLMGGRVTPLESGDGVLCHPGSFSNELFEIYTLNYSASQIVGVHASEELWFEKPVRMGTTMTLTGSFDEKQIKRGQGYVVVSAEARDEAGHVVVRRRGTEIMRTIPGDIVGRNSTKKDGLDGKVPGRIDPTVDSTALQISAVTSAAKVGDWFADEPQMVTFEQAALYSRLGEYVLSIHGDVATAQKAGLSRPIVQGQQQICIFIDRMMQLFGLPWLTSGHVSAKFIKPVPVFTELLFMGKISEIADAPGGTRVHLECWLAGEDGDIFSVAHADCLIP